MKDININLSTEDGRKAKDVTESKKILDIIGIYEKTPGSISTEPSSKINNDINIIEEEEEEDADRMSSFTPSPNLDNPLKNTGDIINEN